MSYNITKVSTKEPDTTGEITLNLADVSSVSAPSANQVLGYNGTNWVNQTASWVSEYDESLNTSYNGLTFNNSYQWEIPNPYLPSGDQYFLQIAPDVINNTNYIDFNTTSGDISADTSGTTAQWFHKFTVNTAGVYRLFAKVELGYNSATNASLTVQWSNADNTEKYGPRSNIHLYTQKMIPVIGVIDASVNDEFGLYMHAKNNGPYAPGAFYNTNLVFEKLS
jgi:hypothetical protein